LLRQRNEQGVDFILRHGFLLAGFPGEKARDAARHQRHDGIRHQPVIDHGIGAFDGSGRFDRQQFGIARTGADEGYLSRHEIFLINIQKTYISRCIFACHPS